MFVLREPIQMDSHTRSKEFVFLMAMLMSMVALTVDAMLPALAQIGETLNVAHPNDNQLIVAYVFLGMAMGQLFYGPISDAYGRKPAIYLGIIIFLTGALISILSTKFETMLIGRILQGMGAASCRVVTLAMIRDRFSGREMAQVMSLIMLMFIMVPALAPSIGQAILWFAPWQAIFLFLLLFGFIGMTWLALRQEETLSITDRIPLSFSNLWTGIKETLSHPQSRNYTFAGGIMFGAFVGYLTSAQQILQFQYQLGNLFALYFGILALSVGLASFANSKLVMKFSMEGLCVTALYVISGSSLTMFTLIYGFKFDPSLWIVMPYLMIMFFGFGILFGNFNTLAVHALGHIAGVANSVISVVQTLLSVLIGGFIGQSYDGTVGPLVLGFTICGVSSLLIAKHIKRRYPLVDPA